ncbi:hypothetical protein [Brevundimonas sp.]|uniref:hypothetical protein n=1 Tax=Brevundimonas sp. TaxID=1871086 RepID=UPI00289E7CC9|nr:hypothetical protein [Brevundimonas sp.]
MAISQPPSTTITPALCAADLEQLAVCGSLLSELGSEKLTNRQLLFFYAVAYHDLRNLSVNIPAIRELYPTVGRAIEKSKETLFPPSKHNPDGLGWIEQVHDEDDRRMRWLKLTPKGRQVAEALSVALRS